MATAYHDEELEQFVRRVNADYATQATGADEEQIDRIAQLLGEPLPSFYRWFLATRGRKLGSDIFPSVDLSADAVLAAASSKTFAPRDGMLLIGRDRDEMSPSHFFYDLNERTDTDARVVDAEHPDDEANALFAGLREMIAWAEFDRYALWTKRQRLAGFLTLQGGDVIASLPKSLGQLGFRAPIDTGSYCCLLESDGCALTVTSNPEEHRGWRQRFRLGGPDQGSLRRVLGELTARTSFEVKIDEWAPPIL